MLTEGNHSYFDKNEVALVSQGMSSPYASAQLSELSSPRSPAQSAKSVESALVISGMLMSQSDHTQSFRENAFCGRRKKMHTLQGLSNNNKRIKQDTFPILYCCFCKPEFGSKFLVEKEKWI